MARAKRTDRAEARRRYRAALAEPQPIDAEEEADAEERAPRPVAPAARTAGPGRSSAERAGGAQRSGEAQRSSGTQRPSAPQRSGGAPFQRVGFIDAFRLAARPADVRADIAALPEILVSKALWPISIVVAAAGAVFVLFPNYSLPELAVSILLQPPALIPPFVAGLLAPRGAWLAGGLAGVVCAIVTSLVILVTPGATPNGVPLDTVTFFLVVSPLFGLGVGAFAGFYRRFLRLSSPGGNANRARPRRGDGRSRMR